MHMSQIVQCGFRGRARTLRPPGSASSVSKQNGIRSGVIGVEFFNPIRIFVFKHLVCGRKSKVLEQENHTCTEYYSYTLVLLSSLNVFFIRIKCSYNNKPHHHDTLPSLLYQYASETRLARVLITRSFLSFQSN